MINESFFSRVRIPLKKNSTARKESLPITKETYTFYWYTVNTSMLPSSKAFQVFSFQDNKTLWCSLGSCRPVSKWHRPAKHLAALSLVKGSIRFSFSISRVSLAIPLKIEWTHRDEFSYKFHPTPPLLFRFFFHFLFLFDLLCPNSRRSFLENTDIWKDKISYLHLTFLVFFSRVTGSHLFHTYYIHKKEQNMYTLISKA